MMSPVKNPPPRALILGDGLAILLVTWVGFISHGESIASPRWLTTFLPLGAAWALSAPWLGLYHPQVACSPRQLWRIIPAMTLAAPLAGILRGVMLDSPVLPVFVAVLGLTSAAGMALWRLAYALVAARSR